MRILLAGDSFGLQDNLEGYTRRALERLGHTVVPFDYLTTHLAPVAAIPVAWRQRLRRWMPSPRQLWRSLARRELSATNQELIALAEQVHPDLILVLKGTPVTASTLQAIKERFRIPVVNWCPDDPFRVLREEVLACYDALFVTDLDVLETLRQRGRPERVAFLPFACDPDTHRTVLLGDVERRRWQSDICFVGTYYPYRARFLEPLSSWNLAIWGPGWEELPRHSPLRRYLRGGALRAEEWVKAYNAATLVLHISAVVEKNDSWVPLRPLVTMRPFEALGCGVPLLVTWNHAMARFFQPGVDLDAFASPNELQQKVRYYLTHPEERRQLGRRGQAKVYAEHTYLHRMQELLQAIQTLGRENR